MRLISYNEWMFNRFNKIKKVFGEDWFQNKSVLELGCDEGHFGIEMLKLGSQVTFSDINDASLNNISQILQNFGYRATTLLLDQNQEYNLNRSFDLILHMSTLYQLDDWRSDLRRALSHTNQMILETITVFEDNAASYPQVQQEVSDQLIEEELSNLGCKFIRFDNEELNTQWNWYRTNIMYRHIYNWNFEKYKNGHYTVESPIDGVHYDNHFRRMWLVLK